VAGQLVVFSGVDGAGKSTQIQALVGRLRLSNRRPIVIWSRVGYTACINRIKRSIRQWGPKGMIPVAGPSPERDAALSKSWTRRGWLFVALLDLFWLYAVRVRIARWFGHTVICDRYLVDSELDCRLNFPAESVSEWWMWRMLKRCSPVPDARIMLLVPVEVSRQRSAEKEEPFPDTVDRLVDRHRFYQQFIDDDRWHCLDGQLGMSELADDIDDILSQSRDKTLAS